MRRSAGCSAISGSRDGVRSWLLVALVAVSSSCTPTIKVEGPAFSGVTNVTPCPPCVCAVSPSGKVVPE